MSTDLPLHGLLLGRILGMEVGPPLLVYLAIQLVLVSLTHPTPDFAKFAIEIVHRLAMKFQLVFLTGLLTGLERKGRCRFPVAKAHIVGHGGELF